MYADTISEAMQIAIEETKRRRTIQEKYNIEHNIIPQTIVKEIRDNVTNIEDSRPKTNKKDFKKNKQELIKELEIEMKKAAKELDFERAMELRDAMFELSVNED